MYRAGHREVWLPVPAHLSSWGPSGKPHPSLGCSCLICRVSWLAVWLSVTLPSLLGLMFQDYLLGFWVPGGPNLRLWEPLWVFPSGTLSGAAPVSEAQGPVVGWGGARTSHTKQQSALSLSLGRVSALGRNQRPQAASVGRGDQLSQGSWDLSPMVWKLLGNQAARGCEGRAGQGGTLCWLCARRRAEMGASESTPRVQG